jgi:uncharacterized membrane protein YoaK (UPF0700 family)
MPTEARHHLSGPLTTAVALAFAAGAVDAFVFQRVTPVFVANMSGNLIRFGIATGTTSGTAIAIAGVALACFVLAAFAATAYIDRQLVNDGEAHARQLLLFETALLLTMLVVIGVGHSEYEASPIGASYAAVALGAAAMGVQAVSIRRVGAIAVSTTYGTGALVRLGEKVALGLRRAERDHDVGRRRSIAIIVAVLVGYVAGAAVAAALPAATWVLVMPIAIVAGSAFAVRRTS